MADPVMPGGYRNPAFGQAAANLSSMFAPPSGTEVYAYTRAAGEKDKQKRLGELWTKANTPGVTLDSMDPLGVALGLFAPNQSMGSVRIKDDTDRRGQDIQSNDKRRGQDLEDSRGRFDITTRSNDNKYKVDADNERALQVAIMAPTPKDAVVTRPPEVAKRFDVPAQTVGVIAAQPGETNYVPDGKGGTTQLNGVPKPLTETELKAKILERQDPETQAAIVFGNTPTATIPGADGKPRTVTVPQQLKTGAPSIPKDAPHPYNTKNGPVIWDHAMGTYVDPVTRRPVDISGGLQSPTAVQSKDPLGPTTANQTEANRKDAQLKEFDAALDGYESLVRNNPGAVGLPGDIRGVTQNAVSVVQEFTAAFGKTPLDAVITPEQALQLAARVGADQRDPAIQKARVFEADLAYKWAQLQNPTGEVSRQAFERGLEVVAGGTLRNNQTALESIAAMREVSKRARSAGVATLRNPGGAAPAPGAPPPAQPRPTATGPNGEKLEYDGNAWVPVK